jgi:glutamate dehydrogenase
MSKLTRDELLRRAAALAKDEAGFAAFLAEIVAATDPEDLVPYGAGELEKLWRKAFAGLDGPHAGKPRISIAAPQRLGGVEVQVIDIISPDMPFIVDSVLAAVRAEGGQVRFMAHPVLKVGEGRKVSFLEVHVEPLADAGALKAELTAALADVEAATSDWRAMRQKLEAAAADLPKSDAEARAFLTWLDQDNFTFLGTRDYRLAGKKLAPVAGSGLGILRNDDVKFLRQGADYVEVTPQHEAFMAGSEPLLVTKANIRARVHRRAHMD